MRRTLTLGGLAVVAVATWVALRRAATPVLVAENPSARREASVVSEP